MLLKEFRLKRNLKQKDLAKKLDITLRQYQRVESGESFLTREKLNILEDFFNIPQRILLAKSRDDVPVFLKSFLP